MVKVKICGITNPEDALLACSLGADYLGFNFYTKSPRFIEKTIAKFIIKKLPSEVKKVGVFVNEKIEEVRTIYNECGLDFVQLHGDENQEYCEKLNYVIKAFRVGDGIDMGNVGRFNTDYYLFDAHDDELFGGTGKLFDWKLLKGVDKEFFLAGGLNPDNVMDAIKVANPYAVDVCSGLESKPGLKDPEKMRKLFEVLK